jgi:hypothetical protein
LARLGLRKTDLPLNLLAKNTLNFKEVGFPIINPSILFSENKFYGVARFTNSSIEPICDYKGLPIQRYREYGETLKNGIVTFATTLHGEITEFKILHDLSDIPNFEDPRIFKYRDRLLVIMTNVLSPIGNNTNPWKSCMVLEDLSDKQIIQLASPLKKGIEKNWIPIENVDSIKMLYSSNPVSILNFQEFSNSYFFEETKYFSAQHLNNRSQVVATPLPEVPYIRIASKKFAHSKVGYTPFHYFEILSETLEPIKLSKPFVFSEIQMEMCQGLTLYSDLLVISWTELDKYSKIGYVKLESVFVLFV